MDKEKIKQLLIEQGYPDFMLDKTIDKLESLDPKVSMAFRELLEGHTPSITVEGYTYESLVQEYRMKPVGAILTLNWLVKSPHDALISLKQPIKL